MPVTTELLDFSDPLLLSILSELRNSNDEATKIQIAQALHNYVANQYREMSNENFKRWITELLKTHIWQLINSPVTNEKISGLIAINSLISLAYDDATSIIANYYRFGFKSNDPQVMGWASKALGHLSLINSNITAECVEFDMQRALEWLQGERQEAKRHAACLVLRELATNAPTLFYGYVAPFVEFIWVALRDPKPVIRECAVEALGACLKLISQRESRFRLQWYQKIFEEAQKGFTKQNNLESIHASLITIGELLKYTGGFLRDRFHDITQIVLKYKGEKERLIRRTVMSLFPILASFASDKYIDSYFDECANHLLFCLKKDFDRPTAFLSLGEVALVVGGNFKQYLSETIDMIHIGLTLKAKYTFTCPEALQCVSMLAKAVGKALEPYVPALLDKMFAGGLSQALTDALGDLARAIPEMDQDIQKRLLDLLSTILAGKPFNYPGTPKRKYVQKRPPERTELQAISKDEQDRIIALALNILGSFNFNGQILTELLRWCVVNYLKYPNLLVRREAAECCCKLMSRAGSNLSEGHCATVVSEVLEQLLALGIADSDSSIRSTVMRFLDERFDYHLAQAANLRSLFVAFNDEIFEIREQSLQIICRLGTRNPAHVMPSLRKVMIQLLRDLEHSGDNQTKEESSKLLGHLISATPSLARPYVGPLMKALLPKLRDSDYRVASGALATVGELSVVSGEEMESHLDELLPLIIETLQDQSSSTKREVAIRTLGQLTESTGYVIKPFHEYPKLLDTILNQIQSETNPVIRMEVIKVFGILGALDPYRHKLNQLALEGRRAEEEIIGKSLKSENKDVTTDTNLSPSSEDYYPTITIASLMRILRDPSLSQQHPQVIHALMLIVNSLGLKCIQFLPQIIPPFLQVMRTCETEFRTQLFQHLGQLVARVKQHIRDYLDDIFKLVNDYWHPPNLVNIITLVEGISVALGDEFKPYIPDLLKKLQVVLRDDNSPKRDPTLKVLHAFEVFGNGLDEYLHLVIPSVVRLCEDSRKKVKMQALHTLSMICQRFNISTYASRILHPIARALEASNASADIQQQIMSTLCIVVRQLGIDYLMFVPVLAKGIQKHNISHSEYETLLSKLQKEEGEMDGEVEQENDNPPTSDPSVEEEALNTVTVRKLKLNETNLRRAWEVSQKSTKEDWIEWLRKFSVELLRESPSPALRSCISLANDYHLLVKELFNAGFVSCWLELPEHYQQELVKSIETALLSPNVPPEILQTLLNLAEFMEQDERPLPIDPRTLGELAEKCHAYAKALHYKETEFKSSPTTTIEALISIYNKLQHPEAALGILTYAQKFHNVKLKESWYEQLQRWEMALQAYEKKQDNNPMSVDITLGKMRCLHALGEWDQLAQLANETWKSSHPNVKSIVAPLAAEAAWNLGHWDQMSSFVKDMDHSVDSNFFQAILAIHRDEFSKAQQFINATRSLVDTQLAALVGESYNRAYKVIVRVQQLSELEEIITYKQQPEKKKAILNIWNKRLRGAERNVDTWKNILAVRSLVLTPHEDEQSWLKFSALCIRHGRPDLSHKTLVTLLGKDPSQDLHAPIPTVYPRVAFAFLKQLWAMGSQKLAVHHLRQMVQVVKDDDHSLLARIYLHLGKWHSQLDNFDTHSIPMILNYFQAAIKYDGNWYKAWHNWAMANYEAVMYCERTGSTSRIHSYVVPAIKGFFRSIGLAPNNSLQDTLRLLTLWFKHGTLKEVESILSEGFTQINIDTWLHVIPQIIARIHAPSAPVRRLIQELLTTIGKAHPQALVYPLTVASKSQTSSRVSASLSVMDKIRKHSAALVEQAQMVSDELIRVSILWHEMWHEGLEEASRLFFADKNPEAMLATLKPLHSMLEKGPETIREISFQQAYGRDLQEAFEWCKKWERSHKMSDINQAWDLYYHVFRRINKQLPQLTTLELQHCSPRLLNAKDLELAVPGVYVAGEPVVQIASFNPTLNVITSKQRPRKLIVNGSDGAEYMFLLKGHEDLRQDERVMQLFGLVNTLLASEYETSKNHLSIQRYSVIPLSPNSGLIGWVPHCDTLHQLIRDYRDARKILINIEHRLMLQMAPDYDNLALMQKVEAFEYALDQTNGQDLEKILWLKSGSSEIWLDRRTNYTRSLAVMSMVGYILGLGDRHPSNLMLDRHTGKVLHIDFGDCFEVAMHREKYPEKIPFRLTRMLINAMEVSGIEGTFKSTCESVMRVLRQNKESLMAVLEAFVYDPIINWRLLTHSPDPSTKNMSINEQLSMNSRSPLVDRAAQESVPEILNRRAIQVINRVSKKLTGKDFGSDDQPPLDVPEQVQRLIHQARSHENLCQCYIGWCPFW